jgi:flagellar motor switch protein FliM
MNVATIHDLVVGDVVEGPDGPEVIVAISVDTLYFANRGSSGQHCMKLFFDEKITRHIKAETLHQAGIHVPTN